MGESGLKIVLAGLLAVILVPLQAGADSRILPEDVQVSTPDYEANMSSFDPPLGTYSFTVAWQGIP
ncbi:MAG: hypothetical protein DCC75_13820, partial [Proteobacteria bacterium]